jgi:hypothetical protein
MDKNRVVVAVRNAVSKLTGIIDLRDAHAYGGVAMCAYGVWQIYPPGAWMLAGLVLFWLGVRR